MGPQVLDLIYHLTVPTFGDVDPRWNFKDPDIGYSSNLEENKQ